MSDGFHRERGIADLTRTSLQRAENAKNKLLEDIEWWEAGLMLHRLPDDYSIEEMKTVVLPRIEEEITRLKNLNTASN